MILAFVFALQLLLLEIYLVSNLLLLGNEHAGKVWLGIYFAVAIVGNIFYMITKNKISLRPSIMLFALYIGYFALRCALDLVGGEWMAKFIGSDAGIIYHLIIGILTATPIAYAIDEGSKINGKNNLFKSLIFIVSIIITINSIRLLFSVIERTRDDLYLLAVGDDLYQWPGDLLSIRVIISTILFVYLISEYSGIKNIYHSGLKYVCTIIITINFSMLVFFSQIIGSNKTVLIIVGCWVCFVSFVFAVSIVNRRLKNKSEKIIGIFALMYSSISRTVVLIIGLGFILYWVAMEINFPFEKFRIFGFGSGEVSSIESRIALLLDGFLLQFSISPFLGNAAADYLTLGEGNYMHSMLAYTLTHTGLIGFNLIAIAFFAVFVEQKFDVIKKVDGTKFRHALGWQLKYIILLILILVLFVGFISSSVVWGVVWFTIGLFMTSWNSTGLQLILYKN